MSVLDKLSEGSAKRWLAKHLDHADSEFCLMWPFSRAQNGYGQIGEDRHIPHRIMCEHRNGPAPTPQHQAAHSCGRGHWGCVNPWHLNWRTPAENQFERHQQHGVLPRNKLTPVQVDEIRSMRGRERTVDTATRFGVTEANIRQIQSGKTWKMESVRQRIFSEEEVALIRATPDKTITRWAEEFGVHRATIRRIRDGTTYQYYPVDSPSQERP